MGIRLEENKLKPGLESKIPSLICKDFILHGDIKSTHAIRIEGTIFGNIIDAENVVIGTTGLVRGNISAKKLIIFGYIEGDVSVSESTAIRSSGRVNGKITTHSLTVESGAAYEGRVVMQRDMS